MAKKGQYRTGVPIYRLDIGRLIHSGEGVWSRDHSPEALLRLLIERYGSRVKVELGPGKVKNESWGSIGLNGEADPTADIFHDLNEGIPLPDSSVDEFCSNQTLEHIERGRFIFLMNELWRTLKPGGSMSHCVPHYLSPYADGDPTHKNRFTEATFQYFCVDANGNPFVGSFSDYGIACRFVMEKHVVRPRIDIDVTLRKPG